MDNENSVLLKARHSEVEGWHRYDFLINGSYGWNYCQRSVDELLIKDISDVKSITASLLRGGQEIEFIDAVRRAGSVKNCPELAEEKAMLSIGGVSQRMECLIKVVWCTNTSFIRVFTSEQKDDYILVYMEQMIRHCFMNFAFNPYSLKGIPEIEKLGPVG